MRLDGVYIGLGNGDTSDEVDRIKDFMRRKFSYAKDLADTALFDDATTAAVATMQENYRNAGKLNPGEYVPGVINKRTKEVMGYLNPPPPKDLRPLHLTVCGTGVPWWVGPDADIARAVEHKYYWQPVGYPAAPFPMGKSIDAGRREFAVQALKHRTRIEAAGAIITGYSQGAVIMSEVWEFDIKPASGALHWMKPHIDKAAAIGNPMREVGNAVGDANGAPPPADSGGVTETLMVDTPTWWLNIAHDGDLYVNCAGESGENKRAIWKIIRGMDLFKGPDSILAQVLEALGVRNDAAQLLEVVAIFKAIWDAGLFFARRLTPHTNYLPGPVIDYYLLP